MKALKLISITVLLFVQAAVTTVFAQDKPKAGDTISGIVRDQEGPMMQVYVTERDSENKAVTYCETAMDGTFSFILVNPKDSIKASYVGYVPVVVPIDRTYIEIKMKEHPGLSQIDVTGHGRIKPLELKPGTVISGRVLDAATNEPLGPYASIIETKAFDETQDVDVLMQEAEGKLFEIGRVFGTIERETVKPVYKSIDESV